MTHRPLMSVLLGLVALYLTIYHLFLYTPPPDMEETVIKVQGRVYKKEETKKSSKIYIKSISPYSGEKILIYNQEKTNIKIGELLSCTAKVSSFDGARNPGAFDQKKYYERQGIYRRGLVETVEDVSGKESSLKEALYQFRRSWKEKLVSTLGEEQGNILAGIILGEKGEMNEEIKEAYRLSGIGHILAISGIHISILGIGFYKIIRRATGSFGVAAIAGILVLLLYILMVGWGISIFRAFIMYLFRVGAEVVGRKYDLATALVVAGSIILFYQPMCLFDGGFWLSHLAVVGIGLFSMSLSGFSISLILIGPCLYFFYEIPVYSFFLNLMIVPLMSLLLFFGLIGSIAAGVAWIPCKLIISFYTWVSEFSLQLPMARLILGRPPLYLILSYYGILLLIFFFVKKRKGVVLLGVYFLFILLVGTKFYEPEFQVTMVDVGQGDGIFIREKFGGNIFIDGGSSTEEKVGQYQMEPFLKYKGVRSLDYVLISHGDSDHYSGILEMIQRKKSSIPIRNLVLPAGYREDESLLMLAEEGGKAGIKILEMGEGDRIQIRNLILTCWAPAQDKTGKSSNEDSMVLSLNYKEFSMLFTGDLEGPNELLVGKKVKGNYDVLKVAHHGSKNGTSADFLKNVKPKVALISAGVRNTYGHPHKEVIERLKETGCEIYSTKESGAVTIFIKNKDYPFRFYISKHLKYNKGYEKYN
ncbi:DNA internalization-related competence protein ComEC/Rec2 [Aequitasia blattaphilus]|uniref:DNA internalization-related competence protein ComEC/Rec2 n=1 Tax=Aequitasia blattaphilus TaxID=2949332 RepID=A0ABT1E8Y4_9FIRM|nr:DNA internalization-related competence protein ComEC/Rec2 [Aequitasia blattaphilus]MCP1102286.1 DNA internalization-related competence protein ComEC/Rec2 [Aequitasia blattaphilus]MCR8614926.1 DNA internalization-related competence protein ComEC/Rec2 [Aequitasia blattaphilus]